MNNPYLKRLRMQFITVMMSIVIVFLTVIFGVQYYSTRKALIRSSENALQMALAADDRDHNMNWQFIPGADNNLPDIFDDIQPETGGGMIDRNPLNESRTPVLLVHITELRNVTVIRNNIFFIENDDVETIALSAFDKEDDEGRLEDYSLRYCRKSDSDGSMKIAMTDISDEVEQLSSLLKRSIIIFAIVVVTMFIMSLILSKLVLKPVARAWEDQKRFVADASHELKTPLTVILSNTDMVINSKDEQSPKNKRRLDNIKSESIRMKELVQELLEVARGDMDDKPLIKERLNLSELIDGELLYWEPVCFEEGRTLTADLEEEIEVTGDPTKLKRLISILVDNALKYSKKGTTISVTLKKEGQQNVTLAVEDTGDPIGDEDLKNLFGRFYRADKSREEIPGYGLGLSIAEAIVSEHGGKIWAESRIHQNENEALNIFSATIPLKCPKL